MRSSTAEKPACAQSAMSSGSVPFFITVISLKQSSILSLSFVFQKFCAEGPRPHASRSARSTARCCVFYFLRHTRSARTSAAASSDFSSHHTIFSRLCQESGRRGMHFVPQKHTFQADCSHPLKYCGMLYFVKLSGNRSFPLEFWNKDASRFYFLTGFPVQHGRSTADF